MTPQKAAILAILSALPVPDWQEQSQELGWAFPLQSSHSYGLMSSLYSLVSFRLCLWDVSTLAWLLFIRFASKGSQFHMRCSWSLPHREHRIQCSSFWWFCARTCEFCLLNQTITSFDSKDKLKFRSIAHFSQCCWINMDDAEMVFIHWPWKLFYKTSENYGLFTHSFSK